MDIKFADAEFLYASLLPQVQFIVPARHPASERLGRISGADDLDDFTGASYVVNETLNVAVKRYLGEPAGYFTLYAGEDIDPALSLAILDDLGISSDAVIWSRGDVIEPTIQRPIQAGI